MSHESRPQVREARPEDREAAIGVLTASFRGFGPVDQVVGDDDKAEDRRRRMYEMALKEGVRQHVIVAERDGRIEGVLTYVDWPDCSPGVRDGLAAVRLAGRRVLTVLRDFRVVDKAHPRAPHRHLPALGVRPEAQGQGVGALLMREYARRCDEAGLEGYLETVRWADPARRAQERLYERHGFAVAEVVPMTEDWSMVTMKRPAGEADHEGTRRPPRAYLGVSDWTRGSRGSWSRLAVGRETPEQQDLAELQAVLDSIPIESRPAP